MFHIEWYGMCMCEIMLTLELHSINPTQAVMLWNISKWLVIIINKHTLVTEWLSALGLCHNISEYMCFQELRNKTVKW